MTEIDTRPTHTPATIRPKRWPLALASAVMIASAAPGAFLVASEPSRVFSIGGEGEMYRGDVMTVLDEKYEESIDLTPRPSDTTAWDTPAEIENETDVYIDGDLRTDCTVTDVPEDPRLVCEQGPLPTAVES